MFMTLGFSVTAYETGFILIMEAISCQTILYNTYSQNFFQLVVCYHEYFH